MLTPETLIQQFDALPDPEKAEIAEAMNPRLAALLVKVLGPEFAKPMQMLDSFKGAAAPAARPEGNGLMAARGGM